MATLDASIRRGLWERTGPAGAGSADRLLPLVTGPSGGELLRELMRAARGDRAAAEANATRSYRHPLGFEKLVLRDAEPDYSLRLHVWWPDARPGVEHVHNHRYGFATAIVRGGYQMRLYQRADAEAVGDAIAMTGYVEQVSGAHAGTAAGSRWSLTPTGAERLRVISSFELTAGGGYALAAETLHQIHVPPGQLCVTLFLQTELVGGDTRVFTDGDTPPAYELVRRTMSAAEYQDRLSALLLALA
jgi:hypothetical protein